jgi:hypothetical protein
MTVQDEQPISAATPRSSIVDPRSGTWHARRVLHAAIGIIVFYPLLLGRSEKTRIRKNGPNGGDWDVYWLVSAQAKWNYPSGDTLRVTSAAIAMAV